MDFTQHDSSSPQDFVQKAVTILSATISRAIAKRGHCVLGLSGGSTPRPVYEALAKESGIDWSAVTIFLVDERCVLPDHRASNQRMIRECFAGILHRGPVVVHPDTVLPPDACADDYNARLQMLFHVHGFASMIVLGLGEDGHTASLFPPVPAEAFGSRFAIHTKTTEHVAPDRISVSLPVLEKSETTMVLLTGEKKRAVWEEMISSPEDEHRWPLKAVLHSRTCDVVTQW